MNRIRELPWPRLAVAGVLILVIAAGIAWYGIRRQQATKSLAHRPVSVLVGDFANHTGDPVLDDTLEPMLGVALEGASFINSYSRGDARKLAKKLPNPTDKLDEQSARLVAVNQGVNAVITGDISLRGDQYDISAIALDAVSGAVIARSNVTVTDKQDILRDLPSWRRRFEKLSATPRPPQSSSARSAEVLPLHLSRPFTRTLSVLKNSSQASSRKRSIRSRRPRNWIRSLRGRIPAWRPWPRTWEETMTPSST